MKKITTDNLRKEKNGNGIYRIYDRNKKLVYVGRSSNGKIKHHLVQHFGSSSYSGAKFGDRTKFHYSLTHLPKGKVKQYEQNSIKRIKPRGNKYVYLKGRSKRKTAK
jgi:excinuclease UvrABC nuclease subunit